MGFKYKVTLSWIIQSLFGKIGDSICNMIGWKIIEEAERRHKDPLGWYREDFDSDVEAIAGDNPHAEDITKKLRDVYLYLNKFMPNKRADIINDVKDEYRSFLAELHNLHQREDYSRENIESLIEKSVSYALCKVQIYGHPCPTNYEMFCNWFGIEKKSSD